MAQPTEKKQSGWRGSEDLWLDAAYEVLIDSGVDAVKVMPLAKALKISRTSFYWHFQDREALLDALVQRWRKKNTGNLIAQTRIYAETATEAILNLFDCWINPDLFDAKLDFAIRNWAQQSPELKSVLEDTDRERIAAITDMFIRVGTPAEESEIRALTVYYTQIGYISMMVDETLEKRLEKIPTYVEIFAGKSPSESDIARFLARHRD